ncbi:MAG: polymerase sigma-70 factor, subfamily [Actinomycetota bacterium]|jgi:RNA polymerase sigma-70 factor (ECF subfamily)|nr:polymerase sigma-70 factor, subfamily [Actinomycetota bacterium]
MALRVDDVDLVRDRALVERFQEGDPAAFETLYKRYFDRLTRFCQKRVGDRHEAEEIAQEAFTRALRALPTFQGERRFYPWMTVIAGRLCVDTHRRRGRSEPTATVDLGVIEGGQERIVDAVDVAILSEALGRLATRHREVLDLREQQGWSYQQIADHYGVTLGTVEALLFRARKALRREYLAVVGDERSWAALPVVGLLLRRLGSMRARFEAWLGALPSVGAPAVMVAAIAVTAVTGVGVGVYEQHHTAAPPSSVRMGSPSSSIDSATLISSDGPAASTNAGRAASPAGPATAASPAAGGGANRGQGNDAGGLLGGVGDEPAPGVYNVGRDDGVDQADGQPLTTQVGDLLHAGADPDQVQRDAQATVDTFITGRIQQ